MLDNINDEVIQLLRKSGCKSVFVGLETGSQRMQVIARKRLELEEVEEKILKLLHNGIHFETNFIVGFPEETYEDLIETIMLAGRIALLGKEVSISYSYMSPEPHTDVEKNVGLIDYRIVKSSQVYQDLQNAGLEVQNFGPKHFNHLYTVFNENYDILQVIRKADKFFELITKYKFTFWYLVKVRNMEIVDIFELLCSDNYDPMKFALTGENKRTLYYDLIFYEIFLGSLSASKEEQIAEFYHDVKLAYKDFLNSIFIDPFGYEKPIVLKVKKSC